MKTINAGKYDHQISIYSVTYSKDAAGFQTVTRTLALTTWANVKTTRGMEIIRNNSSFEQAYTNFTIRFPKTPLNRDMQIDYGGKTYEIAYLNNINEENIELEIQAKEVTH